MEPIARHRLDARRHVGGARQRVVAARDGVAHGRRGASQRVDGRGAAEAGLERANRCALPELVDRRNHSEIRHNGHCWRVGVQ